MNQTAKRCHYTWKVSLLLLVVAMGAWSQTAPGRRAPSRRVPITRRINTILAGKEASSARWGILVVDAATNRVVYSRNADERFTPASNTKLFSTALALEHLGPGFKFTTSLRATAAPAGGVLRGDLILLGGGDPTLSGRIYPYDREAKPVDPLGPLEQLADEAMRAGLRVITGDVVGDDSRYPYDPFPDSWTIDDANRDYGAEVSALPFNDGAFRLELHPGAEAGDPALPATTPPSLPLIIDNRVTTIVSGRARVEMNRAPGSNVIRLTGTLRSPYTQVLSAGDQALYAAHALYEILLSRGVRIDGRPVARHRYSADEPFDPGFGTELASRASPTLLEVARVTNKVSQNLHAEILLLESALAATGKASRSAAIGVLNEFLKKIGIAEDAARFEDGSGLSRRTLVTPRAVVALLKYMDRRPEREWEALLPIGGEDGTLARRFEKAEQAANIHAKTGTLATSNALSGYITTRQGKRRLMFSMIANNHAGSPADIRKAADAIALALVDWNGR